MTTEFLQNSTLPDWGPYTKKYIGVSHIANAHAGIRFDLSVFPGFFRRKVDIPNALWESGFHPWEAASDLSYYAFRHQLEWKDRVYCDISYSQVTPGVRLIRSEYVNNTELPQTLVMHMLGSIQFPTLHSHSELLQMCRVELPDQAVWIDGLDYETLQFAQPRHNDHLTYDGFYRGETRAHGFVNGSALATGFGQHPGDSVTYKWTQNHSLRRGTILIRYRLPLNHTVSFACEGLSGDIITFTGTGDIASVTLEVGAIPAGPQLLKLTSLGHDSVELDGLVVAESVQLPKTRFVNVLHHAEPELIPGPKPKSLILKYQECEMYYGLLWLHDDYEIREFECTDVDQLMRFSVHHHTRSRFKGSGEGHFTDVYMRPILVDPHSTKIVHGLVCSGTLSDVRNTLEQFDGDAEHCEQIYRTKRLRRIDLTSSQVGSEYQFSQQLMAATVITNIVFPVYTRRTFIKHFTPGRWWDSLYTWDSGFIGLGLLELDTQRAIECLSTYVTEPSDAHAAFIHHGSPVPVQHYLFLELWNRTSSRELLQYFYPRLRQYHMFLCGDADGSTTKKHKSNLIQTWDYFYNSGGWDDYPPQVKVHQDRAEAAVTPVVNTVHCIRTAKILRMAALELGGLDADVHLYESQISAFREALQEYAWDHESGYFGYVVHDEEGNPVEIFSHESGQNYNMGMDGIYPLIADISTDAQKCRMIEHLFAEDEMWTSAGISTVDQSARYFTPDGYWNGTVWMPHQWFFWKALLDLGKADLARKIAFTALDVWKRETDTTYNCFEHFVISSQRGAGWHQFSGLSSPVLCWYSAYFRPGTVTYGFDVWVQERAFDTDLSALSAAFQYFGSSVTFSVLVVMNPSFHYRVDCVDCEFSYTEVNPGVFEIDIVAHATTNPYYLRITRVE